MKLTDQFTGNLAMIFFALFTALSSIFLHATTQQVPPLLSACNTFLFCLVVYTLFSSDTFKKIALIRAHIYSIFMLNLTTAICWIFTFVSLKYVPPELYLFTYLCAMPISAAFFFRIHFFKSIILSLGLLLLAYTYHNQLFIPGLILALIGGFSATIYSIYSKRIANVFTTTQILSLRFYLTVFLTFILCLLLGKWQILSFASYGKFAILSVITVIIPLALYQVGLKNLSLINAMSFMPLAPLVCYFMSLILGYEVYTVSRMCVVLCLCWGMVL